MIFEFLRRLFWKADEGGRKRKVNDSSFGDEHDNVHSKRHCQHLPQINHRKVANESKDKNMEFSKINMLIHKHSFNLKRFNVTPSSEKVEMLESSDQWSSRAKSSSYKTNVDEFKRTHLSAQKCELLTQYTLYKTQALTEKKQYNEMLLHFIPPEIQGINKELRKTMNEETSRNSKICKLSNKYNSSQLPENQKIETFEQVSFSDRSMPLKTQTQKYVTPVSLEKMDNRKDKYNIEAGTRTVPVEIIKINTLRDEFSNKDVIKQDFVSQITKKYNERIDQQYKEVAELKRMTYILSKHNLLTREAVLENHLNRSMRLCEAVLDDTDIIEASKLPELSPDMMKRIDIAISIGPADEILVQEFGLRITRKDIQTLAGLNWLNDEIINFYMNLLIMRSNDEKYPNIYAMNTFFYPKLISGGHASLKRWTKKIDIFAKDLIVVPIHLGIHWCMSIIDFRNKSIRYYDSMGSPNYKCLQVLKQYLLDESLDKKKKSFDFCDWNFECMKDIPQQMNGSDCGVFSCVFAEYICANKNLEFGQEDMPYFRNKMVYEILTVQLL